MANVISRRTGCWIQYQLKLSGLGQKTVANEANCSVSIVSHFLCDRKDSLRVRAALCKVPGCGPFEAQDGIISRRKEGGMTQQEFEKRTNQKLSAEEYAAVERDYMGLPKGSQRRRGMSEANVKQAAVQELCKAVRWETTDIHSLYYGGIAERAHVQTGHSHFYVNAAGDSVPAMICDVADATRKHEGLQG
jgi:hypothetical protein